MVKKQNLIALIMAVPVFLLATLYPSIPIYSRNHMYSVKNVEHRKGNEYGAVNFEVKEHISGKPIEYDINCTTQPRSLYYKIGTPRGDDLIQLQDGDIVHERYVRYFSPFQCLVNKIKPYIRAGKKEIDRTYAIHKNEE